MTTKDLIKNLSTPSNSKYFIKYLITSYKPGSEKIQILSLPDGSIYASKVNKGEALKEVIQREMPILIGSENYKLLDIQDGGTDFDRHGNRLQRYNLHISTSYFEPELVSMKYNFVWKDVE